MRKKEVSILVLIYNSYKDPLFQNLLLNYIKTLSKKKNCRFDLITFEQKEYNMTPSDISSERILLKEWNIFWHPRKFHTGKFLLLKKLYDVLITFITVIKIRIRHRSAYVFAFANVAAAFSILFSKLLNLKLVIYSYEPHSNFMVELGLWKKKSLKYIVLNTLEKLAGKYADHIMTGTKYMVEYLKKEGSHAQVYRAPTAVDERQFHFNSISRSELRKKLNIEDRKVFVYFGKFGDLYHKKEIIQVFKGLINLIPNSFFVIATNYDHSEIEEWFIKADISANDYLIRDFIAIDQMPDYLSIADMGISSIPPTPSQKFRSPTKVAEYLLCGLPYITCEGISEDDVYAIENSVGIVLKEFSIAEIKDNQNEINKLLEENKEIQRNRCRKVGLEYRSKEKIDNLLLSIFNY